MTQRLVLLGLAGAMGTIARYGVHVGVVSRAGHPAVATLIVNAVGCLLLGLALAALGARDLLSGDTRIVLLTGFLGAFTTFSAFMYDTARLARDGSPLLASANVAGQLVLGASCLALGVLLGRAM